jgi:hypothetical protein
MMPHVTDMNHIKTHPAMIHTLSEGSHKLIESQIRKKNTHVFLSWLPPHEINMMFKIHEKNVAPIENVLLSATMSNKPVQ